MVTFDESWKTPNTGEQFPAQPPRNEDMWQMRPCQNVTYEGLRLNIYILGQNIHIKPKYHIISKTKLI